jgi:beta-1,2-mannobiose phosphorylase / 1,2-beta-oligomannan phosphorylase
VFTCANYVWDGYVYIPYAGADSRIFGARIPLSALLD